MPVRIYSVKTRQDLFSVSFENLFFGVQTRAPLLAARQGLLDLLLVDKKVVRITLRLETESFPPHRPFDLGAGQGRSEEIFAFSGQAHRLAADRFALIGLKGDLEVGLLIARHIKGLPERLGVFGSAPGEGRKLRLEEIPSTGDVFLFQAPRVGEGSRGGDGELFIVDLGSLRIGDRDLERIDFPGKRIDPVAKAPKETGKMHVLAGSVKGPVR